MFHRFKFKKNTWITLRQCTPTYKRNDWILFWIISTAHHPPLHICRKKETESLERKRQHFHSSETLYPKTSKRKFFFAKNRELRNAPDKDNRRDLNLKILIEIIISKSNYRRIGRRMSRISWHAWRLPARHARQLNRVSVMDQKHNLPCDYQ